MVLKLTSALGNPKCLSPIHSMAYLRKPLRFGILIANELEHPWKREKNEVWAEVVMEGFAQMGPYFFFYKFIYIFFGCIGSSLLRAGFL